MPQAQKGPFPLFDLDLSHSQGWRGAGRCAVCERSNRQCIAPDYLLLPCPKCKADSPVFLSNPDPCAGCGSKIPTRKHSVACPSCILAGKAGFCHNTELGMVRWEDALAGLTHGAPGLESAEFETVVTAPAEPGKIGGEEDWRGAKVPSETLMELVRTPNYPSLQGDQWKFCCRKPMVYKGEWDDEEFTRNAPKGGGHKFFLAVMGAEAEWVWKNEDVAAACYVFRCGTCSRYRGHYDFT